MIAQSQSITPTIILMLAAYSLACPPEPELTELHHNGTPSWSAAVSISPRTTANRFLHETDQPLTAVTFWFVETVPVADLGPAVQWTIFDDTGSQPGDIVAQGVSHNLVVTNEQTVPADWEWLRADFDLGRSVALQPGLYWLGLHAPDASFGEGVGWTRSAGPAAGSAVKWKYPGSEWRGSGLSGLALVLSGIEPACPWDLDSDGLVGVEDAVTLIIGWGDCENPDACSSDFDCSGFVWSEDLVELIDHWGDCP